MIFIRWAVDLDLFAGQLAISEGPWGIFLNKDTGVTLLSQIRG